jgi:hypothetical protein
MTETTPGREIVQLVEIVQPLCGNVYGAAPCTASGPAAERCYNTRATCQDGSNYALGDPLRLFFSRGHVAEQGIDGAAYIIPSLVSVSTSPTRINLAGANPDAQGLGNRALCTITLADHQHTDRLVDPYLDGRTWDPLDRERGSFWSRWLVRNRYRQNIIVKVYEGYAGQTLAQMTVRQYFLQSIAGPSNGRVTLKAKDVLAKIEERKAQAPIASPGELYAAIDASQTSIEVAGALVSEYAASGTLRIGDELMTYSAVTTSANGITFTITDRGSDGTTAAEHDAEASVQQCLRYTNKLFYTILQDLLETYGGIDSAYLDTAGWQSEIDDFLLAYRLSTLITEPTSVAQLVSELQEQSLVYVWWDERDALVKIKTIRGIEAEPPVVSDSANIIAGSVSFQEMPRQRASQVWVWYGRDNFVRAVNDVKSYASLIVDADLESEGPEQYGEKSIRKIFARWLSTGALAETTASKIIRRYVDVPSQIKFRLDAKDRAYWIGDVVAISHYLDVDAYGARRVRYWTITSAEEVVPGEIIEYHAEDTTLYGRIHYVMATGAPDYPGYDNAPFRNCYVGDAAGLLSDGQDAGRIS